MAHCITHGISVDVYRKDNGYVCDLQAKHRVGGAKFAAALNRVAAQLHAKTVEFRSDDSAHLELRSKKKLTGIMKAAQRAICEALAPRKRGRRPVAKCGHERPRKRPPAQRAYGAIRAQAR